MKLAWALFACLLGVTAGDAVGAAKVYLQTGQLAEPAGSVVFGQCVVADGTRAVVLEYSSVFLVRLHVFRQDGFNWVLEQSLESGTFTANGSDGPQLVALSGDRLALGNPNGNSVKLYERVGSTWSPAGTLTAPDSTTMLGYNVTLFGDTLAASSSTGVYVFQRSGSTWTVQAKFPVTPFYSGVPLALGADRLALLGLSASALSQPAFHTYRRSAGLWQSTGLLADSTFGGGPSGINAGSVAISGNRLAVATASATHVYDAIPDGGWSLGKVLPAGTSIRNVALRDNQLASATGSDVVSTYEYVDSDWRLARRLTIPVDSVRPFANAMAFGQGSLLAASWRRKGAVGDVYVYSDLPLTGGVVLGDSLRNLGGSASDSAGEAIAFSNQLLVVGAPAGDNGGAASGEAYVFRFGAPAARDAAGSKSITLAATLRVPGGSIGDKFGAAVAVSPDGNTIVVGAPGLAAGNGGAMVFRKPVSGWDGAIAPTEMLQPPADTTATDVASFGASVAIDERGDIAVGAPASTVSGAQGAGLATVFKASPTDYSTTPDEVFIPAAPQVAAEFGGELGIAAGVLAIAAPGQDRPGPLPDTGAVYSFRRPDVGAYQLDAELTAPAGGTLGDKFGRGLGVGGASPGVPPIIVVGVPGNDGDPSNGTQDTGGAYVFGDPGGGYVATHELRTSGRAGDQAGTSISVSQDAVLLGAPLADRLELTDSGTAYVFKRPRNGWLASIQALRAKGTAGPVVVAATAELEPQQIQKEQFFGTALALSTALGFVSAPSRDVTTEQGAVIPDQGEIDVYSFDDVFVDGFESVQ